MVGLNTGRSGDRSWTRASKSAIDDDAGLSDHLYPERVPLCSKYERVGYSSRFSLFLG